MIVDSKNRRVLINARDPDAVAELIPVSNILTVRGRRVVSVPHELDVVKVLRNMGVSVPSPALFYYSWPGRFCPTRTQRSTVDLLSTCSRGYCLNEIGTGKTMAMLWLWDYLRGEKKTKRLLVIAPLSTLERTWADELFIHMPHLSYKVLYGTRDTRLKLLNDPERPDVYIVNHDGVRVIGEAIALRDDIDAILIDELSQCARNAKTETWKALKRLVWQPHVKYAWGMTGTPTPNAPTDAWAQARLITPDTVPKYFGRFRDAVMRKVSQFRWVPRENAVEVVHDVLQPAVRFTREDTFDLPPTIYETRTAELSPEQARAYKAMQSRLEMEFEGEQAIAVNAAVKVFKLVQIASGAVYSIDGETIDLPADKRIKVVKEVIESAEGKVIVYVPFISALLKVATALSMWFPVETIYSSVKKLDRDRIFHEFQHGNRLKVLVAQPGAMSHGLNLTAANVIVWYAPIHSHDIYEQANGRITRGGQTRAQLIINIEGSPIERRIYKALREKKKIQDALLEEVNATTLDNCKLAI